MSKPNNAVRAELYADKRKIVLFNLGLFAALAIAWLISCIFITDLAYVFAGMVGVGIFYVMFAHETWGLNGGFRERERFCHFRL